MGGSYIGLDNLSRISQKIEKKYFDLVKYLNNLTEPTFSGNIWEEDYQKRKWREFPTHYENDPKFKSEAEKLEKRVISFLDRLNKVRSIKGKDVRVAIMFHEKWETMYETRFNKYYKFQSNS